ncbi:S-adenosylmethionine:tRNA ribosyltransferase-isomerase [Parasediminibacterium paludis]|uniref:S-adenosylmethionine:tRNA ribosyltransferase-isomerase n=1 Tax=Parasediminibacterium paludis TaxID=908966 RepID=A0ABV8PW37_9BACT
MIHPKKLSINDFSYHLPDEKIAKHPLAKRDESKLLVFKSGKISESQYKHLDVYLPEESLLIFNNTKVVEARLIFTKPTGGQIEIFCLEPHDQYADITTAMLQKGKVLWKCLVGGAKKWKEEPLAKFIQHDKFDVIIEAKKIEQKTDCFIIELSWNNADLTFAEILHIAGLIPLPPYLNRDAEEADKHTYQTIYAKYDGSVAAPTAGLHFTEELFKKLDDKNIKRDFVTLHVGAGTFKPVKAATMDEHEMHTEFIDSHIKLIEHLLQHQPKPIIAVGTTSLRTIESLYWLGVLMSTEQAKINEKVPSLSQWDAYDLPQNISLEAALTALTNWMKSNQLERLITKTQIIIAPGYQLRVAQGLITNFHQPQSTLLLLIAAIVGDDWKMIYNHALNKDYRFLSYGDGCLLMKG